MTEYILKIEDKLNHDEISNILNLSKSNNNPFWEHSINENKMNDPLIFLANKIEHNYNYLKKYSENNLISIWIYKSYKGEGNIEFSSKTMKLLSKNNITLCVSFWEIH